MKAYLSSSLGLLLAGASLALSLPVEARNWEAQREYREGMREISRERREMRREVGRELRHGRWNDERDDGARLIAGVLLGAVVVAAVRGQEPEPPAPDLCWYWSDASGERGYWDRCGSN